MIRMGRKLAAFIYGLRFEGVVIFFASFVKAGPCGPTDSYSGLMLIIAFLFHLPGLVFGAMGYFLPHAKQNNGRTNRRAITPEDEKLPYCESGSIWLLCLALL